MPPSLPHARRWIARPLRRVCHGDRDNPRHLRGECDFTEHLATDGIEGGPRRTFRLARVTIDGFAGMNDEHVLADIEESTGQTSTRSMYLPGFAAEFTNALDPRDGIQAWPVVAFTRPLDVSRARALRPTRVRLA